MHPQADDRATIWRWSWRAREGLVASDNRRPDLQRLPRAGRGWSGRERARHGGARATAKQAAANNGGGDGARGHAAPTRNWSGRLASLGGQRPRSRIGSSSVHTTAQGLGVRAGEMRASDRGRPASRRCARTSPVCCIPRRRRPHWLPRGVRSAHRVVPPTTRPSRHNNGAAFVWLLRTGAIAAGWALAAALRGLVQAPVANQRPSGGRPCGSTHDTLRALLFQLGPWKPANFARDGRGVHLLQGIVGSACSRPLGQEPTMRSRRALT